jgi:hypothetical protein
MENRCKDFGELSPANRVAGCMKIDMNCTGLRARHARKGNGTATNQKKKPPMKAKSSRFDSLVARYYPAVYSFASRLTDDPRDAVAGAHCHSGWCFRFSTRSTETAERGFRKSSE